MNPLRNCILIALAFDASQQEIDAAHDTIDKLCGNPGGIDPSMIVADTGTSTATPAAPASTATPVAPAPTATPVAPAPAATLDGDGLPWDERIHSSNKQLTDKGVWRARRNVDAAFKKKIEAELRGTIAAPAAPTLPGTNLPPMPGVPAAPAIDPNYTELVSLIAANTHSTQNPAGRITDEWVGQVIAHYGVPEGSLQNLAHSPDKVLEVLTYIKSVLV